MDVFKSKSASSSLLVMRYTWALNRDLKLTDFRIRGKNAEKYLSVCPGILYKKYAEEQK